MYKELGDTNLLQTKRMIKMNSITYKQLKEIETKNWRQTSELHHKAITIIKESNNYEEMQEQIAENKLEMIKLESQAELLHQLIMLSFEKEETK